MQDTLYVMAEACSWICILGTVLGYFIPCPEVFQSVHPILWPLALGCAGTLILRPALKVVVLFHSNLKALRRASNSIPLTADEAKNLGIQNPVDFCWQMAHAQIVQFNRFFGDTALFMQTNGAFEASKNKLFQELFGRRPVTPVVQNDNGVTLTINGVSFLCSDPLNCWELLLICETARAMNKEAQSVTQADIIRCLSKGFTQKNNIMAEKNISGEKPNCVKEGAKSTTRH